MKHQRLISFILAIMLLLGMIPTVFAFNDNPFPALDRSTPMPFTDVQSGRYYYDPVQYMVQTGLTNGTDATHFSPNGLLTRAQVITFAVRIRDAYEENTEIPSGTKWYDGYVKKASSYGMLPSGSITDDTNSGYRSYWESNAPRDYSAAAVYNAIPSSVRNTVFEKKFNYKTLPDMNYEGNPYYWQIIALYNAGVLSGVDNHGTFNPSKNITRAEIAAIIYRTVRPEGRITQPVDVASMSAFWHITGTESEVPYELELMDNGSANLTVAEIIKIAIRIYEKYHFTIVLSKDNLNSNYAAIAKGYGIIKDGEFSNYNKIANRAETIGILYRALPSSQFGVKNNVLGIPDMMKQDGKEGNKYYDAVIAYYRAGIISGTDAFGTFKPNDNINLNQLKAIVARTVAADCRKSFTLKTYYREIYGYSGAYIVSNGTSGFPLYVTRIGDGPKALVLSYVLHGTEDVKYSGGAVSGDGNVIKAMAENNLIPYLLNNYDTLIKGKWSVYLCTTCNPDGLQRSLSNGDGNYQTGAGRRTEYRLSSKQTPSGYTFDSLKNLKSYLTNGRYPSGSKTGGIDMNRSFPTNYWKSQGDSVTYYTGVFAGGAPEVLSLYNLARTIKTNHGSNHCYAVDTHGWYSQILTIHRSGSSGVKAGVLNTAFSTYFTNSKYQITTDNNMMGSHTNTTYSASGYFARSCYDLGYQGVCLFELPKTVYTNKGNSSKATTLNTLQNYMQSSGAISDYLNSITYILRNAT